MLNNKNHITAYLIKFGLLLFFAFNTNLVSTQVTTKKVTLSINAIDDIKIKAVYISFFESDKIYTITSDFQNIELELNRINVKVERDMENEDQQNFPSYYFFTNVLLDKPTNTLTVDAYSPAVFDYKEQVCFTDQGDDYNRHNLEINNNSDYYIFKLIAINKDELDEAKWDNCHGQLNNIDRFVKPNSRLILTDQYIYDLGNTNFIFGYYDPSTKNLATIFYQDQKSIDNKILFNIGGTPSKLSETQIEKPKVQENEIEKTERKILNYKKDGYTYDNITWNKYDEIVKYDNHGLEVKTNNRIGFIDFEGNVIIPIEYASLTYVHQCDGFHGIDFAGNHILFDEIGNELISFPKDKFGIINLRFYKLNGKEINGVYDFKNRAWVADPHTYWISNTFIDESRLITTRKYGQDSLFISDLDGNILATKIGIDNYETFIHLGLIIGNKDKSSTVKTLIDIKDGITIFEFGTYDNIKKHNEFFILEKEGKFGVYHPKEKIIFPCIIDKFIGQPFSADEIKIEVDGVLKTIYLQDGKYLTK